MLLHKKEGSAPLVLDRFRAKLVIKILYARSADEISRYIRTAISAMRKNEVNTDTIARFMDKIIHQLNNALFLADGTARSGNLSFARNFLSEHLLSFAGSEK